MKSLRTLKVKAFTLIEMKDSKILYILHFMTTRSDVTCTLSIKALAMVFWLS